MVHSYSTVLLRYIYSVRIQLRIETGRYEKIPLNEMICSFCTSNKIEDQNHSLLDCKAYSQIRDIFFSKINWKLKYLTSNHFHTIL